MAARLGAVHRAEPLGRQLQLLVLERPRPSQRRGEEVLVPRALLAVALVAPLLDKLDRARADEDVADVEGRSIRTLVLQPLVAVAARGRELVRAHQHVRLRERAKVRQRVAHEEGVGVDGERVDAGAREIEDHLHLVQPEHPEGVRAPPSVRAGQLRVVDQVTRHAVLLEATQRLRVQRTDQKVRLVDGEQVAHPR